VCIRSEARRGTHDKEQSGRGAAMICTVYDDRERWPLALDLAQAMLAGPWTATAVAEAAAASLEHWPSWLDALALRVTSAYRRAPDQANVGALAQLIVAFLSERRAGPEPARGGPVVGFLHRTPALRHDWPVATVASVDDLAAVLELSDGQLAWLADVRGLERTVTAERLRNYRYAAVPRRSGLPRVIEAPKLRLKEVQRWILREILDHVPVHEAAQGFARGRSVIDHARRHSGQPVVLRLDLADFFASVSAGRVFGIFRTLGYGDRVAHALTGLTTNVVPQHVWTVVHAAAASAAVPARFRLGRALATPHLPQGAPTSPALANLAAFRLDRRLSGLAAALGLRYSRYADDLTFSGAHLRRRGAGMQELVATIVGEEGFALNRDKSVLRTRAARQSVCGVVVNAAPNVSRAEYDRLKAILHNAARHGPSGQGVAGRQAELQGRVAWVASLNPARGEKLKRRFAEIDWSR
jgi:RNA-directed DNA polymerase